MTQLKPFDDLYAVPIPKGAKNVTLIQSHSYFNSPRLEHSIGGVDLPTDGNWQLLFTTESATEQDWAGVVDKPLFEKTTYFKEPEDMTDIKIITKVVKGNSVSNWVRFGPPRFKKYDAKQPRRAFGWVGEVGTATEAGHSLMAANGLEGNYAIVKK